MDSGDIVVVGECGDRAGVEGEVEGMNKSLFKGQKIRFK